MSPSISETNAPAGLSVRGRVVVRASAWRLVRVDTDPVAGTPRHFTSARTLTWPDGTAAPSSASAAPGAVS